jgi:hypothetical protein
VPFSSRICCHNQPRRRPQASASCACADLQQQQSGALEWPLLRRPAALSLLGEDLLGLQRGGLADSPEKMKILPENETHTRVSARARRWQKETMVILTRFRPSSSLLHARRTRDGDLAGRRPVSWGLARTSPCSSCSLGRWNGLVTVLAQTPSGAILYRRGLRAGARCGLIPHGSTARHRYNRIAARRHGRLLQRLWRNRR